VKSLDKYIVGSTIFSLFSESFAFHFGVYWKLFYLIIGVNLGIILITKKLKVHTNLLFVLAFMLVHGIIMYIWNSNPISSLIAQVLGIGFSSFYFYNFVNIYGVKDVFKKYLDFAFYISILAIPMFYLGINSFNPERLNGILVEPAHYAAIMLPAAYVLLKQKDWWRAGVIILTILLSKSTIGFFGLVLIFVLPLIQVKYFVRYSKYIISVGLLLLMVLTFAWNSKSSYNRENHVVRRLKQTSESFDAITTGEFKPQVNLSSYALLSNSFVTYNSIKSRPFGVGMGGYQYQYEKFFPLITLPDNLKYSNQKKINKFDANSLFLRSLVDLGVFSLIFFFFVVYKGFLAFRNRENFISQGVLVYLIVKIIREGHYFPPEFYFFLMIFFIKFEESEVLPSIIILKE
jgi:hypothetical protein